MKERERTDFPLLRIACWSSSTLYLSNYMKKNSTDTRYRTRSPSSVIIQSFCSAKEWIIPSSPDSRPPAGLSINVSPLSFFPPHGREINNASLVYIYIIHIYINYIYLMDASLCWLPVCSQPMDGVWRRRCRGANQICDVQNFHSPIPAHRYSFIRLCLVHFSLPFLWPLLSLTSNLTTATKL